MMRLNQIIIRPIRKEDYARWEPLWIGYNEFYGRSGPTALDPEITRATWQRFFDVYEPVHAVVAEYEGQLVGLAHYLFHRSTTTLQPVCYMQDLFTAHAARGKGVGRALIEEIYQIAGKAGAARVYWQTYESNLTARRLYDALAEHEGIIVYRHMVG